MSALNGPSSSSSAANSNARASIATGGFNYISEPTSVSNWSRKNVSREDAARLAVAGAARRKRTKIDFHLFNSSANDNIAKLKTMVKAQKWPEEKERENLQLLLNIYKRWANDIAPDADFDHFVQQAHKVGHSLLLKAMLEADIGGALRFRTIDRGGRVVERTSTIRGDDDQDSDSDDDRGDDEDADKDDKDAQQQVPRPTASELFDSALGKRRQADFVSNEAVSDVPRVTPTPASTLTDAQRERAERNRLLALERRAAVVAAAARVTTTPTSTTTAATTDPLSTVPAERVANEQAQDQAPN